MRICSSHFEGDCFYKGFKVLRPRSVPTLALNKPPSQIYTNPERRAYNKCCVRVCKGPWEYLTYFPKDKTVVRKWCHNLQLDKEIKLESLKNWKICLQHFEKSCFDQIGLLRPKAVPTLKLGHRQKLFKNTNFEQKSIIKRKLNKVENEETKDCIKAIEEAESKDIKTEEKQQKLKTTKIETESLREALRPLKPARKPQKLVNKTPKKTKIVKTKFINKKEHKSKTTTDRRLKALNVSKEEIKKSKQITIKEKQETLAQAIKPEEKLEATATAFNETSKPNDIEDSYLENLLEILTENDNITELLDISEEMKQETIKEDAKTLSELQTEILEKSDTSSDNSQTLLDLQIQLVGKNRPDFENNSSRENSRIRPEVQTQSIGKSQQDFENNLSKENSHIPLEISNKLNKRNSATIPELASEAEKLSKTHLRIKPIQEISHTPVLVSSDVDQKDKSLLEESLHNPVVISNDLDQMEIQLVSSDQNTMHSQYFANSTDKKNLHTLLETPAKQIQPNGSHFDRKTEDESSFTIYEIKQETLEPELHTFSQDHNPTPDDYLEERPYYEPSDHSDHEFEEEEREKQLTCKNKNLISCCIKTCPNYDNFQPHIPLFKFPNIRKLREHWLANCKLNHRQYTANGILKRLRVCIEHFDKNCLKDQHRLLFGAVPTLKLGRPLDSTESLLMYSYLRCRVLSCQRSTQYDKINRIQFPQGELKTKWCSNLNIEEQTITTEDWICHRHFEKKTLIDCRKPKVGMLPTLLLDSLEFSTNDGKISPPLTAEMKCCVASCNNDTESQLCKFPKNNEEIYKKWLKNLKLKDSPQVRQHYYICDKHFEVTCFYQTNGRLKANSVPTLHLEEPGDLEKETQLKCSQPLCKEKPHILYNWPNKGIFKTIWLQKKKFNKKSKHVLNRENKEPENIKLCDEHFYQLYRTNENAINDCKQHEQKDLRHKVKLTFDLINTFGKIHANKCAVPLCTTDQNIQAFKSLRLFCFPKTEMAKKWCYNIDIEYNSLKMKPQLKICELHFEKYCFHKRKYLLNWAVPTLNLPPSSKNLEQNDADEIFGLQGQCCIKSCPNAEGLVENTHTRFYKFPQEPRLLKQWLQLTNCNNYEENFTRICGLHFQETEFNDKNKKLKIDAVPKYYLDSLEQSPDSSILDDLIQVKQELDNSEEDSYANENLSTLKTQIAENMFNVKFQEVVKEPEHYPLLEIKEEILEIQEQEPLETSTPSALYTIQKFETSPDLSYTTYTNNAHNNPASAFVISDVKSQIYLCCVQKCPANSETPGIRMFNEFPNDSEIFIKWCFNLKIDPRNYQENQYAICQQHFESVCFTEQGLLQPWSVPTLNLNLSENSFIHQNDIPEHLKPCTEQCIVYGCINPLQPLFRFPYQADLSLKWFSNLKLDYTDFRAQNYRICRRHFASQCFEINNNNQLKAEAMPTLYLGHTDKIMHLNSLEEQPLEQEAGVGGLSNQDNSRGSSQGSLARLISPHDLEDHDSSYFEDFEEYYGQDD